MNPRILLFLSSMLIGVMLSACGPSQAELDSTATQLAAQIFATQTAQAPTSTPTSTPSPTPTVTPTATATPTPTPTPTITPTPAPQLSEAALTLDDLPAGFLAMTEEESNQMMQSLPANVVAFGYTNEGSNQLLLGYLIPYASQAEQLAFDQMMPQLCESLAAGFGATSKPEELEGLEDIGETRTGCTSVTATTEGDVRFDTVLFRRGEIAAIIIAGYLDAEQPAVSVNDLARLIDQRVSQFLGLAVTSSLDSIPLEELIASAQAEGELTVIALPHDWANYGEIIETFQQKYGLKINEFDPDAGSADQLEAIRQNQGDEGPQAPDVIDIGLGYTGEAQSDGLITPYKVSGWDSIPDPVKDPAGSWWGNYFGVLTFVVNPDAVENIPQDWDDLLKPEYKGKVAMGGEVTKSNQAVMTVMAAGLSRTNGEIETAPEAGLQFWKEMKASGNLLPVIGNQDTLASGETPIVILWDYLALADSDLLAGNPNLEIVVPQTGVLAGPYANAISAYAPHPNAARLWSEFIMSDEGQLLFLEGYVHPIRFFDMLERGVIPQDLLDTLPPTDAYKQAVFLTPEEMIAAKDYIVKNWVQVVGN